MSGPRISASTSRRPTTSVPICEPTRFDAFSAWFSYAVLTKPWNWFVPRFVVMSMRPPWKPPYSAPAPSPRTSTWSIQLMFGWMAWPPIPGLFVDTPSRM